MVDFPGRMKSLVLHAALVAALLAFAVPHAHGAGVPVIKFPQLQEIMAHRTDTTYVINFFATWCDPCKEEFPAFQQWSAQQLEKKVRLLFVSLDFKRERTRALATFLKTHHVRNDVVLLDETDYNAWINRVDSSWNGNLPMTLVISGRDRRRHAYPQTFTLDTLRATVAPFIP